MKKILALTTIFTILLSGCSQNNSEELLSESIIINGKQYTYPIDKRQLKEDGFQSLITALYIKDNGQTYVLDTVLYAIEANNIIGFVVDNRNYTALTDLGLKEGLNFDSSINDFKKAYKTFLTEEIVKETENKETHEMVKTKQLIIRNTEKENDESYIKVFFNEKEKVFKICVVKDVDFSEVNLEFDAYNESNWKGY